MENGSVQQTLIIKMIIELTEKEWIEVMKLVEQKCGPEWQMDKWNEFNDIKTKMLWQFGNQKE